MHLYCALSKMATFQRRCCACMPFFMYYCCLCTSSITVSDTGQYQAVILLYEEHELARLRVSVADSTVPLVCAPTFPGSHHVSSSLWLCKFSFCYNGFVSILLEVLQPASFLQRPLASPSPMTSLLF